MEASLNKINLTSRVVETKPVSWRSFQYIQQQDFKELPAIAKHKLKESILQNNFTQPFYVWEETKTGIIYCLDGRHRTLILEELSEQGNVVPDLLPATFIDCKDKQEAAELVLVYSSIYAKVTQQGLFDFIQLYELDLERMRTTVDLPDFDAIEFEGLFKNDNDNHTVIQQSLQERFIIPPFSIFDTRQGYWQERKKIWNSLFDSQETREDIELIAKSGQAPAIYELRNKMRESLGREPEWDEIIAYAKKKGMHIYSGASVFDPVLTEVCYNWFCPEGGSILDPFAGGSVRGIVAGILGFKYYGIDLRADQVKANFDQLKSIRQNGGSFMNAGWTTGDSNVVLDTMADEDFDFLFSCPPYHDLEKYSEDPADLSNMTYSQFLSVYRSIITKAMNKLKVNRFACFVISDIRDEKGFYRDFVSDTIDCFTKCVDEEGHQVHLYNEIILINVAGLLPVRVGRQFESGRKVGKMHQNVLVFYKGDPKKIREEFPKINMVEYLQQLNYQPNIELSIVDD